MGEDMPGLSTLTAALNDLENLPPVERARAVPDLIHQAMGTLAAVRAGAMREMEAGGMKRTEIAAALGISRQQVTQLTGARPASK